ncbi:hypothetical protein IQ238_25260 [Pleurocapsales cyanobacterium LEGE 06147]|nr:hypothetical protein [Pleurocapsales cyanobacterium LEGE 06147]
MVKYSLELKIKNHDDVQNSYRYTLDLNSAQENRPEQIFEQEICQRIKQKFQTESACKISDANLNRMIAAWKEDIREGYRNTTITLDLPLLIESEIEKLQESGNQQLPEMIEPNISEIEPQIGALPPLVFSD